MYDDDDFDWMDLCLLLMMMMCVDVMMMTKDEDALGERKVNPAQRNIASPPSTSDPPFDEPGFIQSPAAVLKAMRLYPNNWEVQEAGGDVDVHAHVPFQAVTASVSCLSPKQYISEQCEPRVCTSMSVL